MDGSDSRSPWLLSFAGPAGTGKTTIAKSLCARLGAAYVGVDGIDMSLRKFRTSAGDSAMAGYSVGFYLALANLSVGNAVVADSVNPNSLTRRLWQHAASSMNARFIGVEVHCSDEEVHKTRLIQRYRRVAGDRALDEDHLWRQASIGAYQAWRTADVRIDTTALGRDDSVRKLIGLLC